MAANVQAFDTEAQRHSGVRKYPFNGSSLTPAPNLTSVSSLERLRYTETTRTVIMSGRTALSGRKT